MSGLYSALSVAYIVFCIIFIAIILMQKKRSAGTGVIQGVNSSDSYWSSNKSKSGEERIIRMTQLFGAIFFLFSIVLMLLK